MSYVLQIVRGERESYGVEESYEQSRRSDIVVTETPGSPSKLIDYNIYQYISDISYSDRFVITVTVALELRNYMQAYQFFA